MNKRIEAQYALLETTRHNLLLRLEKIDIQKLNTPPAPSKWSVAQVFYHLNKAEGNSVLYVSKKRLDINNLEKTGFKEAFKMWLVKFGFLLPVKYSAPDVLGAMPDNVDYKTIVAEWDETRKHLKELLASLPDDMLNKNVFKQPVAGRLNIYQMLDFMQAHFNRHVKQVRRIVG